MPFTPSLDRFYSPLNQAHLARVAHDMDANTSTSRAVGEDAHAASLE